MANQYSLKVSFENRHKASIDDYFDDANWIWHRDKTERSVLDLWLHVVDHCARLVEAVRKERPKDVIDDLADTIMWLFSLLAQAKESEIKYDDHFRILKRPSELIWNKYPGFCPACLDYTFISLIDETTSDNILAALDNSRGHIHTWIDSQVSSGDQVLSCRCLSRIVFAEERHLKYGSIASELDNFRVIYANKTREHDINISDMTGLQTMFESIFGNSYQVFSVQTIAFHLLEEVGEVSQALKDCYTFDDDKEPFSDQLLTNRKLKLEEEIADVFSWLFALMLKIKHVYYRDAKEYFESVMGNQNLVTLNWENFMDSVSLPDIIWAKYGTTESGETAQNLCCPACFSAPCKCNRDLKISW